MSQFEVLLDWSVKLATDFDVEISKNDQPKKLDEEKISAKLQCQLVERFCNCVQICGDFFDGHFHIVVDLAEYLIYRLVFVVENKGLDYISSVL